MKVSEITIQDLKNYARIDSDDEDTLFTAILTACKTFVKGYTGLPLISENESIDTLEKHEDVSIAIMVLANEMYENRQYTVQNDKVNKVVESILSLYRINLL